MAEELTNNVVQNACNSNHTVLSQQIANITLRQQELQNHISHLESNVSYLEQIVSIEKQQSKPNYDRIKGCFAAISKNIELITDLYDCYRAFEDVKFKYHKQISESNYKYIRLNEVEIRQIEEKLDRGLDAGLSQVLQALMTGFGQNNTDKSEVVQKFDQELLTDPRWKI